MKLVPLTIPPIKRTACSSPVQPLHGGLRNRRSLVRIQSGALLKGLLATPNFASSQSSVNRRDADPELHPTYSSIVAAERVAKSPVLI